jgi:hypothetical protein
MPYKIAGIDVHKKVLMVVVIDAAMPEEKAERRRFATMPSEMRRLSVWLREQGVEEAVMGTISTVAGSGSEGFSGDGGPAVKADFYAPAGIAVDTAGNIFIADAFNARVRRVDHLTRKVSTFAGDGLGCTTPPCGDGGLAVDANITAPGSLAVDSSGNLYIADPYDAVVRRVDATTNIITTVAGDYVTCSAPTSPCGDGGLATSANLRLPFGVAVGASGDIFIADSGDNRVRVVDGKTGVISPKAFTGQYNFSGDGGSALQATMARPLTLALDSANNLFISGGYDVDFSLGAGLEVVRRVDGASGIVTLVAGQEANPTLYGFSGDGGLAIQATLNNLGIAVDSVGNLYIADAGNDRIRKVSP